ncbi:alpha/beta hydrolase [Phenylobacterium sp. LjRoot219]|uniref:alpha/beta fold hydrolase n=1 Tax=Phenylobacterium sp. LjRoot219 TaxID=3342283 RepID=UPI003ED01E4B
MKPIADPASSTAGADTLYRARRSWLDAQWAYKPDLRSDQVEGATIRSRVWNAAADHLPGLVLVHGFRAHARWWDHIAPAFTDRFRVIAPDLSGMGDSDHREAYSRAQHAREVLAAAASLGPAPVTLVAHSYGGMVSLIATRAAPERIARLVIIDVAVPLPTHRRKSPVHRPARIYPDRAAAAARFKLRPGGGWPDPDVLAYVAEHSVCERDGGWTWKFDDRITSALGGDEDHRALIRGIVVPVDVIFGDRSEVMAPPHRAEAKRIAPLCGEPVEIPACHHHVMIEQPAAMVTALRGLLANAR